jgi:hypothetical protein
MSNVLFDSNNSGPSVGYPIYNGAYAGQSLTGNGHLLSLCKFYIERSGTLSGSCYAQVYAHTGMYGVNGVPTGSPLATSDAVNASTLSAVGTDVSFTFTERIVLQQGVYYVLAFYYGSGDATHLIYLWSSPFIVGTNNGNGSRMTSAISNDIIFEAYSSTDIKGSILGLDLSLTPSSVSSKNTPVVHSYSGAVSILTTPTSSYNRLGGTVYAGDLSVQITPTSSYRKGNQYSGHVTLSVTPASGIKKSLSFRGSVQIGLTPSNSRNRVINRLGALGLGLTPTSVVSRVNSGTTFTQFDAVSPFDGITLFDGDEMSSTTYAGSVGMTFDNQFTIVIRKKTYKDPIVHAGCPLCGTMLFDK